MTTSDNIKKKKTRKKGKTKRASVLNCSIMW